MKNIFKRYVRIPLILFKISLTFIAFAVLITTHSWENKNQHYYFVGAIFLGILGLTFLFLAVYWCCSDYCERKKTKINKN